MPSGNVDICRLDVPVGISVGKCRPCARGTGGVGISDPRVDMPRQERRVGNDGGRMHDSILRMGGRETRGVSFVLPSCPDSFRASTSPRRLARSRPAPRCRKTWMPGTSPGMTTWERTGRCAGNGKGRRHLRRPHFSTLANIPQNVSRVKGKFSFRTNHSVSHGFHEVFFSLPIPPWNRLMQRRHPRSPTVRNMVSKASRIKSNFLFQIILAVFDIPPAARERCGSGRHPSSAIKRSRMRRAASTPASALMSTCGRPSGIVSMLRCCASISPTSSPKVVSAARPR